MTSWLLQVMTKKYLSFQFAHIVAVCSCFGSDNNPTGCFVSAFLLPTQRLDVCMVFFYSIMCQLILGSLPHLGSLVCLIASYLL